MTEPSRQALATARFQPGQLVRHRRFDYRGVIIEVDAHFEGTKEWYDRVARSHPPKDAPWYHVLPDAAEHTTYVAEQNLETDRDLQPIDHPLLKYVFDGFENGRYRISRSLN